MKKFFARNKYNVDFLYQEGRSFDSLGEVIKEWILGALPSLEKLTVIWAEATIIHNSQSFFNNVFGIASSALKQRCETPHAGVATGDGHCCLQLVIPVPTPQQGLNPGLAFPSKNSTLFWRTDQGWEKYCSARAPMFNTAKNFKISVFYTRDILDLKDNGPMCFVWVEGSPAVPDHISKLCALRAHYEKRWINIVLAAVLTSQRRTKEKQPSRPCWRPDTQDLPALP